MEKAQYRGETKRESAIAYFDTKAIKIHGNCSKMKCAKWPNLTHYHQNGKLKPSN